MSVSGLAPVVGEVQRWSDRARVLLITGHTPDLAANSVELDPVGADPAAGRQDCRAPRRRRPASRNPSNDCPRQPDTGPAAATRWGRCRGRSRRRTSGPASTTAHRPGRPVAPPSRPGGAGAWFVPPEPHRVVAYQQAERQEQKAARPVEDLTALGHHACRQEDREHQRHEQQQQGWQPALGPVLTRAEISLGPTI